METQIWAEDDSMGAEAAPALAKVTEAHLGNSAQNFVLSVTPCGATLIRKSGTMVVARMVFATDRPFAAQWEEALKRL
jgi:hypothetical protein